MTFAMIMMQKGAERGLCMFTRTMRWHTPLILSLLTGLLADRAVGQSNVSQCAPPPFLSPLAELTQDATGRGTDDLGRYDACMAPGSGATYCLFMCESKSINLLEPTVVHMWASYLFVLGGYSPLVRVLVVPAAHVLACAKSVSVCLRFVIV